jgi:hypothetical protein
VTHRAGWPIAALLFALLATANAGGYRYGASDQAFYGPALALAADPALFPRDRAVLAPQMRVWLGDDVFAAVARTLGLDQPALFALIQAVTLVVLFSAAVMLSRALGLSSLATCAFLLLLTLRHRIAKTGANSIEGYMHPRMLAFALGIAALACVLRRSVVGAVLLVAGAAVVHPTTAGWFAIAAVVAIGATRVPARWIATAAVVAGAVVVWLLLAGPLAGRLPVMDADWMSAFAEKDYLIPAEWPVYAWALNLSYVLVLAFIHDRRRRTGVTAPGESGVLTGLAMLVVLFFVSVPLTAAHLALAVQLQVNRVFWLLDAVAAAYLAWWLIDDVAGRARVRLGVAIVCAIALVSAARGYYVLRIETGRPIVQYSLPKDDWTDAMMWLRAQPIDWHVLADPGHAWKYGTSVRLAGRRDTLLESGKDTSMAMYDRDVAMRVRERTAALASFARFTTADVRALAARFGLDVLVADAGSGFDLPALYRNGRFVMYDLR